MSRFYVGGRAGGTGINEPIGTLWNPHGSMALRVVYLELVTSSPILNTNLQRTSTRGTAGTTETPDVDNHTGRRSAPVSGAVLDLSNYAVAPTFETPILKRLALPSNAGGGFSLRWDADPIIVPAGTGLTVQDLSGIAAGVDISFGWDE